MDKQPLKKVEVIELIKAVKEAKQKIERLEVRLNQLEDFLRNELDIK